jgi:hypothetical protein
VKISFSLTATALAGLFAFVIMGCGDHDPKKGHDVYVCGYNTVMDVTSGARGTAYWKNGQEFKLSEASGSAVYLRDMAVDGDDVYVAGVEYLNNNAIGTATYWKNGKPVRLSDGTKNEVVFAITVADGVVYAVGYGDDPSTGSDVAKYWKNGVESALPTEFNTSQPTFALANGIKVVDGDVHIIGFENNTSDSVFARYWKNGQIIPLGAKAQYRYFSDITSQGTDVYIAGTDNVAGVNALGRMVKYWKNGDEVIVGHGEAGKMVVSGSNIYIASSTEAGYYKNEEYNLVKGYELTGVYAAAVAIGLEGNDVVLAALNLKTQDNSRLGSFLFVNGTAQAPFTGDDPAIEIAAMVIK